MNQKDILVHLSRQQELLQEAEHQRLVAEAGATKALPLHSAILSQLGRVLVASGEYLLELHDDSITAERTNHKPAHN